MLMPQLSTLRSLTVANLRLLLLLRVPCLHLVVVRLCSLAAMDADLVPW